MKISKPINFGLNQWNWPKLICSTLLLLIIQPVSSHGTVTSPASRVWNCRQENPERPSSDACRTAVATHGSQPLYDWNAISQNAGSQHMQFVPDGNLASGGNSKYGGLDQVRSDWIATPVSPGPFTITWTLTAPHRTLYYDVYITKESWTPDQPLTWDSLERLVRTSPSPAESRTDIPVTLPNRTGKHVIYSVWQRSDSPEAFYSASDVDFGDSLSNDEFDNSSAYLKSNYPNPFSTTSTIAYALKEENDVTIQVYDVLGKQVSTLVNTTQGPSEYEVVFNGEKLANGMYFYVFKAGNYSETKRMVLQK